MECDWQKQRRMASSDDAPESNKGLLNHLIHELLPQGDGLRWSNSDPITGQPRGMISK